MPLSIAGVELSNEHVGRPVTYIPVHANEDITHPGCESGRVCSWSDRWVFVLYSGRETPVATPPEALTWL